MVLINGVKINNNEEKQSEQLKKPSINEILDKMQVNYNNMNYANNNQNVDIMANTESKQQTNNTNNSTDNNLLLSLLPLLLNNKSDSAEILKKEQNELLHTLIKNLNNPLLEKLFELLPKLSKKSNIKKVETEEKIEKPKIESYVKTDEYNSKN